MTNTVLYLKTQQNAEVMQTRVCVRDIASVYCANKEALTKVKAITVHRFHEGEKKRAVISVLKVIELIEKECPGIMVQSIGETATLLELVKADKHGKAGQLFKLFFAACISFFGTAFTISTMIYIIATW